MRSITKDPQGWTEHFAKTKTRVVFAIVFQFFVILVGLTYFVSVHRY